MAKKMVVKVKGQKVVLPEKQTTPSKGRPSPVIFDEDPFVSASQMARRVKALFYGPTGTHKTRTALQFPRPAVADLEDGTIWYADEFKFHTVPGIKDFATYTGIVDYLTKGNHPYLTFVTDPSTIVWEMLQKQWSDTFLNRNVGGAGHRFDFYNMQPGDWKHVKAEWKDLMKRLMDLDMHVIFTARRADVYAEGELMRKIGEKPDGEKNMMYFFDIVLKFANNEKGQPIATVEKDRTGKLPREPFPLTYSVLEEAFGKEYLFREIDQSLMPAPSTAEPEPEVTISIEPGHDVISHDTNGINVEPPEPPTEPAKIEVKLPKEDLVECPVCEKKVPKLKKSEKHGELCPECMKAAKKPEGSSNKPIKVTLKKGQKKKEVENSPKKPAAITVEMCTAQQEKDIREFCETLEISEKRMKKSLAAYDATSFETLTKEKADTIIKNLEAKLKAKR